MNSPYKFPREINEQMVLASVALVPEKAVELWPRASSIEDWHGGQKRSHWVIAQAISSCVESGQLPDLLHVGQALARAGRADCIAQYLELAAKAPVVIQAQGHLDLILREEASNRLFRELSGAMEALRDDTAPEEVAETVRAAAKLVETGYIEPSSLSLDDLGALLLERLDGALSGALESPYVPTMFSDLAKVIGGYRKGHWTVIAARPKRGKSTVAEQEVVNSAQKARPCVYCTVEMEPVLHLERMAMRESECSLLSSDLWRSESKIKEADRKKHFEELTKFRWSVGHLRTLPIRFCGSPAKRSLSQVLSGLSASVDSLDREPSIVVADYFQRIKSKKVRGQRTDERLGDNFGALCEWISGRQSAGILIAQLNRAIEREGGRLPRGSDLKECGALEQDAAAIIFAHRPRYLTHDDPEECQFVVSENRFGPCGIVDMSFRRSVVRFEQPERRSTWVPDQ